jgi:threonine aldolase
MPKTPQIVDLRSDTLTTPTDAMRKAMAKAEVGDDVFGEDPTVNDLQERTAELLGKEAALFVPSGTMANLLAIVAQTQPGDSVLLHEDAHPFQYEAGGMAMVAGVMPKTLTGPQGMFDAQTVAANIMLAKDPHRSHTTLVCIEQTTNRGGGAIYSTESIQAIGAICEEHGIRLHCDGARIFNAAVASGVGVAEFAKPCHTVSFCFSKGLGCPVGSILVGDKETIAKAVRYRKMLGGGMRQAGVLAAGADYALDHHIDRLAEDHRRTAALREALEDSPNVKLPLPSLTNILFIEVTDAPDFAKRCNVRGVRILPFSATRLRAVFHLGIDDDGLQRAIDVMTATARQYSTA